ncbi:unnamed protein product, partial [Didymodactylos carnosus]
IMNSTPVAIDPLVYAYNQLANYFVPVLFTLGTISSISNVVIFTRKTLRTSPCSMYFLAATINNFFVQYYILLGTIITARMNYDFTQYSSIYCKIRSYIAYILYALSPYFTVLACADRYCSSSLNSKLRNLSKLSISNRLIPGTVIFTLALYLHMLFNYEINHGMCGPKDGTYAQRLSILSLFTFCIIPPALMSTFSILSFRNIKQQRRRIMPVNATVGGVKMRQRDGQLLRMLFFHVLAEFILVTPFSIAYLISTINTQFYTSNVFGFIFKVLTLIIIYQSTENFKAAFFPNTFDTKAFPTTTTATTTTK